MVLRAHFFTLPQRFRHPCWVEIHEPRNLPVLIPIQKAHRSHRLQFLTDCAGSFSTPWTMLQLGGGKKKYKGKKKSGVFPTLRIQRGHLGSTKVLALTKAFKSTVQIIATPSCFQTMPNCTDRKFLQKPDGRELFRLVAAFVAPEHVQPGLWIWGWKEHGR